MADDPSIAARIRDARKRAGIDQKELGAALGVSERMIRNYEDGTTVPYDKLAKIAELTHVDREWLLTGQDDRNELAARIEALEAVLEQIRPGWRELLRPPEGLERLREGDPHTGSDPGAQPTDPEDPPPPDA